MQRKDLNLFILNNTTISKSDLEKDGYTTSHILLDLIRYQQNLPGTKIGCREGDCGACTVLIGRLENGEVQYRSIVSCLTPISNIVGTHVVTIEGINLIDKLTIVQENLVNTGGTQCGACTPGFIVSLTGLLISNKSLNENSVNLSLDGNICRCTGYKSIEKAANNLVQLIDFTGLELHKAIEKEIIPEYFLDIKPKLQSIVSVMEGINNVKSGDDYHFVGGGTDLFVQKPDFMIEQSIKSLNLRNELTYIKREGDSIRIGGSTNFSDIMESEILQEIFPSIVEDFSLIASTPIRNIATIGGNIVNASPIADTVIFFLVLNPILTLKNETSERMVPLINFYQGYKQIDMNKNEIVSEISFKVPSQNSRFNFEKVSKRTYLDIASVNSSIFVEVNNSNQIDMCRISAGGIAPIPKYLESASNYIKNKSVNNDTVREVLNIINNEINPISDIRGSADYKRLLLRQLVIAHFLTLFPNEIQLEGILR